MTYDFYYSKSQEESGAAVHLIEKDDENLIAYTTKIAHGDYPTGEWDDYVLVAEDVNTADLKVHYGRPRNPELNDENFNERISSYQFDAGTEPS